MFGGVWSPEVAAQMRRGLEWEKRNPEASRLAPEDRCVNWMAEEC